MKRIWMPLVWCVLCALPGATRPATAQSTGVVKKRVPVDSAAEELNGLLNSAQEAVNRKDYAAAEKDYLDYLAKKPDDASVHYNLGYVYTAISRPADAKGEYEKAIALDPTLTPAYLNLGLTLLPTDPAAAVDPFAKAADLSPQDLRLKWLLGTALEKSGKLAPAIEAYEAAEKIDGKDFDTRLSLARALLEANRPTDAEPEFRTAIELHPDSALARIGMAQCLVAQKKLEPAASELAAYLEQKPGDESVRIERASILIDLGKDDDALAELDRASAKRPEDLRTLNMRSQIYWHEKRYDDAVPVLQKAAALAPGDADVAARLGEVYFQKKDYPNAVQWLTVAYGMKPGATDVLVDLAAAEYLTKNYPATLAAIDMLSKAGPLPLASYYVRASCFDNLGHPTEALDAYKKFLELNKDENSDMYFASTARVRELTRELQNKKR